MNLPRILVLALAGAAAVVVALYVQRSGAPALQAASTVVQTTEVVQMPTEAILVAERDILIGERLTPTDFAWRPWPAESIAEAFFTESLYPNALEDYAGAIARQDIARGEPITGRKILNPGEKGFVAALLEPGMRAVSVPIRAETGAGGFILPGDRVDVVLTRDVQVQGGGGVQNATRAEVLFENVRVLGIDQILTNPEDEQSVVGSTATLQLLPEDAETLILAEAMGTLTLTLRSVIDAQEGPGSIAGSAASAAARKLASGAGTGPAVVRYGVTTAADMGGQ